MLPKNKRWLLYILVVALVLILIVLEANVSLLEKGLLSIPFLVVIAAVALMGDFISIVLAIVLGGLAVNYIMHPTGFKGDSISIFRTTQFFLSGIIVYLLARRGNTFHQNNVKLIVATKRLQAVIKKLKTEAKGNAKQITQLNAVNKDLRSLVDDFVDDDAYWARKWPSRGNKDSK